MQADTGAGARDPRRGGGVPPRPGPADAQPSGSLPSLFGACHEEPYKPGAGGFGEWPRTKWPWSFELALRPGVVAPKIHMGKTLYLSEETAGLVDPIVRAEIDRMTEADEDWARVLAHLAEAGPSTPDDLLVELGLPRKELKAIRAPLERCGVVVTRWEGEQSFLARWDQLVTRPAGGPPDLGPLVVAAVRAAVVVPEREPARWFSWRWRWEKVSSTGWSKRARSYVPSRGGSPPSR